MGKIYATGDMHGTHDIEKIKTFAEGEGRELTKEDFLIICGDFGMIWNWERTGKTVSSNPEDIRWTSIELTIKEFLDSLPFTTLFVDGNHENFSRLETYPVSEWNGGKVQKITSSIIHLMRGQVYEICGKKIFTFGGARSTDRGPATGTEELDEGICWWPQEICSQPERDEALANLKQHNNKVDFIITHAMPDTELVKLGYHQVDIQTNFLGTISETVDFKNWFAGHYHVDEWTSQKHRILYKDVLQITG